MSVLQLGCGIRPIEGAVNHDKEKHSDFVDVVWDLEVTPWLWADNEFDKIIALDVMEHLRLEVCEWLDECWRILQPNGLLVLRLPAWNHENSHIDPTHRRLFHQRTFEYYTGTTVLLLTASLTNGGLSNARSRWITARTSFICCARRYREPLYRLRYQRRAARA